MPVYFENLKWMGDFAGYEMRHPECDIISYYTVEQYDHVEDRIIVLTLYIEIETGKILEFWVDYISEED